MASGQTLVVLLVAACMAHISLAQDKNFIGGADAVSSAFDGLASRSVKPPFAFKYDAVSSGAGIKGVISGQYLVGCSNNAFSAAQEIEAIAAFKSAVGPYGGRGGRFTLPFVVLSWSLFVSSPAVTPNTKTIGPALSPDTIASIYTDALGDWSAVRDAVSGRPVTAKKTALRYLVRCDAAGSTKVFFNYLNLYSTVWQASKIGVGTQFPGLALCTAQPPAGTAYKRYGLPTISNYQQVSVAAQCKATGCISYTQSGYGKGKSFSVAKGEKPLVLSEVRLRNIAKQYHTSESCSVSQIIPRPLPKADGSWTPIDSKILQAAGALTCPLVSFNYLYARYNYNVGVAPVSPNKARIQATLNYLFTSVQDVVYLTKQAVGKAPADILKQNLAAVKLIKV